MFDGLAALPSAAAVLAGVVGLILLLGRVLRRAGLARPVPSGRALVLKDTLILDTRRRLHLIEHEQRAVLLLTGGETDLVVGWLDARRPE